MEIQLERAIFAGGCFWCMVQPFDEREGVHSIVSGYTGGTTKNPTYEEVTKGLTGHTEGVEIVYDPSIISYNELLNVYWQQTDPTDAFGQFADRGDSYRPVIYYETEEQKELAYKSKEGIEKSEKFDRPIVTTIEKASTFYPAETYHQDYYKKNNFHYNLYKEGSGRSKFIRDNWMS